MSDEELERIRQQKMAELQAKIAEEQARRQREAERAAAMRLILTPEARQRLANLKLVRPELVTAVEELLIRLVNEGRIRTPITDDDVKAILERVLPKKREIRIERI
ncbi:MAG: DNA-binding protein [Thaumarchaeota archaeon]|jgi:programmed cell death protein 5|nr:DNA-binding protein [Candidatus Terraquivivens yellowstonensis]MCL7392789.1 DNA-binding protein [Candidatus Terraquivivens yellowstonensis]MCL7397556.1 DNA-binding protein [Candidatus Terraquivivens yellowstonensis]MCL7400994.1 DNA-binding protein [Candidatus Terraquivivens yellowstonensis]